MELNVNIILLHHVYFESVVMAQLLWNQRQSAPPAAKRISYANCWQYSTSSVYASLRFFFKRLLFFFLTVSFNNSLCTCQNGCEVWIEVRV